MEFARALDLPILNTFSDMIDPDRDLGTLFTSNGLSLRCDYLLVDTNVVAVPRSIHTWESFRMWNKKNDHRPVAAEYVITSKSSSNSFRRRTPAYDRHAVFAAKNSEDPEVADKVDRLDRYLQDMPPMPVQVDQSTHRHLIADYMIRGLAEFFPVFALRKKKDVHIWWHVQDHY